MNKENGRAKELKLIEDAKWNDADFIKLFEKYAPIYLKLWNDFYVSDMELSDWKQEAAIVLNRTIIRYDASRNVTFGSYYKTNLKNRLYDILRRKRAQKRLPDSKKASFSAYSQFYSDTIADVHAANPERVLSIYENLQILMKKSSVVERLVVIKSLENLTFEKMANLSDENMMRLKNAMARCRRKYHEINRID